MIPYLLTYLFIFFKAIQKHQKFNKFEFKSTLFFLIFFIGLKTDITPDWGNYKGYADQALGLNFSELIFYHSELGYSFSLWLSSITKTGIYGVNVICATIFSLGLLSFCAKQKYPWLSLAISYPYLIVAVGFGFTRQSAAIGFVFFAISAYEEHKLKRFLLFTTLGMLFHISAVFILSLPLTYSLLNLNKKKYLLYLILFFFLIYISYVLNLQNILKAVNFYFSTSNNAPGALIKLSMLGTYASIFFLRKKFFNFTLRFSKFLTFYSLFTFIFIGYFFVIPSTTLLYRFSLYLYPLQIIMANQISEDRLFNIERKNWKILFCSLYFFILMIWLNFSTMGRYWLPYQNILFK